eukprot:COSAG06_NODE_5272_length_3594_cov_2.084979_1_plen_72_part_10
MSWTMATEILALLKDEACEHQHCHSSTDLEHQEDVIPTARVRWRIPMFGHGRNGNASDAGAEGTSPVNDGGD